MPNFNRRHYETIAAVLHAELDAWRPSYNLSKPGGETASAVINKISTALADRFAADNPAFDRKRFGAAVHIGKGADNG